MPDSSQPARPGQRDTPPQAAAAAWIEYFRDLGIRDFYRSGDPLPLVHIAQTQATANSEPVAAMDSEAAPPPLVTSPQLSRPEPPRPPQPPPADRRPAAPAAPADPTPHSVPPPIPFDKLAPLPTVRIPVPERAAALQAIQAEIGDCTRCPLAYGGRRKIVFADGSPAARLMFIGEGPGADEDTQGLPFVGKAGQLLNNMIAAMGLQRSEVYIANIVKCRPPANRVPEPIEANTCSPFLLRQIDIVGPEIIVALGSTAATYLLGVRQALSSLRGRWFTCRNAKLVVTYHPAFLLRDPRMKAEAWKDLQMVMGDLGLSAPQRKPTS